MAISVYSFPTTIVFGPGAAACLPRELAAKAVRRPLLISDRELAGTPVFERVRALVPEAAIFTDVDPNPTEKNVLDGAEFFVERDCDGLVAVGGGSPIDAAKAIRLKVNHPLPLADYEDLIGGGSRITAEMPPLIAVATAAGTGSEVACSTVITVEKTNRKTVIYSPFLIPSPAIVDPELTLDLPPRITAGTGMDAFTHNVEAYLSQRHHPICDAIALEGARLVSENLPRVMAEPRDIEARGNMMMASMMGAIALQKGLGASHSLANPLSTEFGMHHGTANAVLLPAVLDFNRESAAFRLDRLAAHLGCADMAARTRELNQVCRISPRLRNYGIPAEALELLAAKAYRDGCHQANPRPCRERDLLEIYRRTW